MGAKSVHGGLTRGSGATRTDCRVTTKSLGFDARRPDVVAGRSGHTRGLSCEAVAVEPRPRVTA